MTKTKQQQTDNVDAPKAQRADVVVNLEDLERRLTVLEQQFTNLLEHYCGTQRIDPESLRKP